MPGAGMTGSRPARVPTKWRPSLGLVVALVLGLAIVLPLALALVLRVHESEFVRKASAAEATTVALVLAALLAGLAGFVIHRSVTRPVKALIDRTRAIAAGDRAALAPLERHGTAELAELSQSLLDMAGGLARRADFIRTFAAHVSHELKSPLTSMRAAAEILLDDAAEAGQPLTPQDRSRLLTTVVAEADRLERLLGRLRELARAEGVPAAGQCGLDGVVADLRAKHRTLAIEVSAGPDDTLPMSAEALAIVLGQLMDNAARHGATRVGIAAARDGDHIVVDVADDGEGIAPGNRERVFDAFFTTRRAEGGTGMGLAIARSVVEAQGGTIGLRDTVRGATFAIALPAGQPRSSKIWPPS